VPSTAGLVLIDGAAGFVPSRTGGTAAASKIVIVASASSPLTVAPIGLARDIRNSSSPSTTPSPKILTPIQAVVCCAGTVSRPAAGA
jgi:hypothetical protein